jgi:hypothetical protein
MSKENMQHQIIFLYQQYFVTHSLSFILSLTFENIPENIEQQNEYKEIDQFTILAPDHMNNFIFRMLSNQQRNRTITADTAAQ